MEIYAPQARADRVIALSRFLLAVLGMLALYLDPDLVPVPQRAPMTLLAVYAVYAGMILLAPLVMRFESQRLRIAWMVVDFIVFSVMIALTRGAASPFVVFFVFSLFCATLRVGARGTVVTAVAAAVVYLVIATADETVRSDPGYLVLRLSYLTVITLFLTHLARYQQRNSAELLAIASWPRDVPSRLEALIAENLRSAATLLNVPRAVAVLEDSEEPWTTVTELRDGTLATSRLPPDRFEELVAPELGEATFFTRHDRLVVRGDGTASVLPASLFPAAVRDALDLASTLSAPIGGDAMSGRIFFGGRHDWSSDDLALAGIAARLFSAQIDQFGVQEQLRRTAVGDERMRVARDLHDGLLQSLTGVALQIQTLRQSTDDAALRDRLGAVQEIIADDQRELRSFVSQLRPQSGGAIEPPLSVRLHALAERVSKQWGVEIEVTVDPPSPPLPSFVASEIYSLVNESLANAAKHAHASHVKAAVTVDGNEVRICVEDDGSGFPFEGTYDLARLDAEHRGPVTLKERIASLGGDLLLQSTPRGARIEMRVRV